MATKSPLFNKVQMKEPPRSRFDLSHENKLSMNMGDLAPFLLEECIPGDKFEISSEVFVRLAPLLSPMMHRVNATVHYFFIPYRLLWNNPTDKDDCWETFITGGEDGTATPVPPYYHIRINLPLQNSDAVGQRFTYGSLADYLGVNIQNFIDGGYEDSETSYVNMCISSLPFRAYAQVYNDYYRDQNLSNEIEFSKFGDEIDFTNETDNPWDFQTLSLRQRAWTKDYFSSALPWVQRGDPMAIPFRPINSDVVFNRSGIAQDRGSFWVDNVGDAILGSIVNFHDSQPLFVQSDGKVGINNMIDVGNIGGASASSVQKNGYYDPNGSLNVPFLQNAATIQDLRIASKIQRWEEAHALSGARYNEQIMTDFFTKVPDYRLQRAEYLGGGVQPIVINEVLQTSETSNTPLGSLAGQGVSAGSTNKAYYYCQEHGFIMGILSILPEPAYFQGLSRIWTKFDRFDYSFPRLQGIGEQPVFRRELLFRGVNDPSDIKYNDVGDDEVFGYQGQDAYMKFHFDEVHGDFKGSLSFWHMARKFDYTYKAILDSNFVYFDPSQVCDPFAVGLDTDYHHFWVDIWINEKASRYLPFWSDPKLN